MGIEHLWAILDEAGCGQHIPLNRLKNLIRAEHCRIAIDAKLIFRKYFSSAWRCIFERGQVSLSTIYAATLKNIGSLCSTLKANGIDHLWCLDGARTDDKLATSRRISTREPKLIEMATIHRRCCQFISRNTGDSLETQANQLLPFSFLKQYWNMCPAEETDPQISIQEQITTLKQLLTKNVIMPSDSTEYMTGELKKLGHQFLEVPSISEGEKLAVIAVETGYCQAVFSSDCDVFPMGARFMIKEIKDDLAHIFSHAEALHKTGLSHEQFISLCVMLGNDFNNGLRGMGKVYCLRDVKKPDFNLYDLDLQKCGQLRVNTCLSAFTTSVKEWEAVIRAIEALR